MVTTLALPPKPIIQTDADPTVTRIFPSLAAEIGLNESIVLLQIAYWIKTKNNLEDGQWWTYQSVREMQRDKFPYWSVATINRIINNLVEKQYLHATDKYNQKRYDKTRWFALNVDGLRKLDSITLQFEDGKRPVSKRSTLSQNDTRSNQFDTRSTQNETRSAQNETTIPETPTETTAKTTTETLKTDSAAVASGDATPSVFEEFIIETMPEALEPLNADEEHDVPDEQPTIDLSQFGQGTTINGKRVLQEAVRKAFDILPSAFNGRVGNFLTGRIPITDPKNPPKWEKFQITDEPMTPAEIIGLRFWREDMFPDLDEQKITLKPEQLRDWVDHFHGHRLRYAAARTGHRELAKILGVDPERLHKSGWYLLEEPEPVPAGGNDPNRIITQEEADELGELLESLGFA